MARPSYNRRDRRHFGQITDIELNYLLTGDDMFNEIDLDLVRQKWNDNRELILQQYKETNPGQRPWCWWEWDHPEVRRKLIGGNCQPYDDGVFSFGCYCHWNTWDSKNEPIFESQADCLKRCGLSDVY